MAKEKSINEMRDEVKQLSTRAKEIIEKGKTESRKLNDEENKEVTDTISQINTLNVDIATREAMNAGQGRTENTPKNFSLRKAILEASEGANFSEETRQMNDVGAASLKGITTRNGRNLYIPVEARAFTATGTPEKGKSMIETSFLDILAPLRDRLVLAQAGANVLTGLVGNIDIPEYSGASAAWAGENAKAAETGGDFTHKTMKPKRLTAKLHISKQLLIQDSLGVEQMLRGDLINAISSALEATILGNHAHSDEKPDGLFTGYNTPAVDLSWDSLVDLETAMDSDNLLGDGKYIMHTVLRGKAKKTVKKAAGALGFILEQDGSLNGYPALHTNAIAKISAPADAYGIVFGNWADLLIGQWGALDLTVDNVTLADEAMVRIIINSYWDAVPRRSKSFAKALMK